MSISELKKKNKTLEDAAMQLNLDPERLPEAIKKFQEKIEMIEKEISGLR